MASHTLFINGNGKLNISRIDLSSATLSPTFSEAAYTYDGGEIKPTFSSLTADGVTLAASDYTLDYSNNTDAGTGTITVTASDNLYN